MKSIQYRKPAVEKVLFSNNDVITISGDPLAFLYTGSWEPDGARDDLYTLFYNGGPATGLYKRQDRNSPLPVDSTWRLVSEDDSWTYWKVN